MKVLIGLLVAVATVGAISVWLLSPQTRTLYCDGAYPVWMLAAQDYDGGGCVEVYPSHAAPPNADWRPYCVGLCNPAHYPANEAYRFGP